MFFSIGFLKPDCLKRQIEQTVYDIIETDGLKIVFKKRMRLDIATIQELYRDWKNMEFYEGLCRYILSGEIEVFVVEGDDAVEHLQRVVGKYDSVNPSQSTIRGRFAISKRENVIHSTANRETFKREAELLLGQETKKWTKS